MRAAIPAAFALLGSAVQPAFAASDYPTLERVDAVLTCMAQHGGQTIANLNDCSCAIDAIADRMPFAEYTEASTYEQYARMPADKGALFRESDQADALREALKTARDEAEAECFGQGPRVVQRTERTIVIEDNATATARPAIPDEAAP